MKNIKNKFIPLLISIFAAVTIGLSGCMDLFDKEDVPTSFTITFNGNGGTTASGAETYTQNYAYGETKALRANEFSMDGKTFAGWGTNTETSSYTDKAQASFSSDTTLYAIWTDKVGLTVTYLPGEDESITVPEEKEYLAGETVYIDFDNIGEREGYTFTGWQYNNAKIYKKGGEESFTMPNNKVILVAQWDPNKIEPGGITTDVNIITEIKIIDEDTTSIPDDDVVIGTSILFASKSGYETYEWYCDGTYLGTTTEGETFTWNTTTATPGENCLTVLATDSKGNVYSETIYVTIVSNNSN